MVECKATFVKSPVILRDIITTNVKSGLGLQYADLLSQGSNCRLAFAVVVLGIPTNYLIGKYVLQ